MVHNDAKRIKYLKSLIFNALFLCQTFQLVEFLYTLGVKATRFIGIERYLANR